MVAGTLDKQYVTPFLDQNLSMTTGGQTYYYSQDGLGSVRTLTDSSGNAVNRYDYSGFGEVYAPGTTVGVEQRYTYTGRERSSVGGPMFYRNRYYATLLGRFMQRDPIGHADGPNLYAYVSNSPISHIDPMGDIRGGHVVSDGKGGYRASVDLSDNKLKEMFGAAWKIIKNCITKHEQQHIKDLTTGGPYGLKPYTCNAKANVGNGMFGDCCYCKKTNIRNGGTIAGGCGWRRGGPLRILSEIRSYRVERDCLIAAKKKAAANQITGINKSLKDVKKHLAKYARQSMNMSTQINCCRGPLCKDGSGCKDCYYDAPCAAFDKPFTIMVELLPLQPDEW